MQSATGAARWRARGDASCAAAWPRAPPSRFAVEHLLLLPVGVLAALAWVNVEPECYYRFTFAIAFVVNDVAIALFFALITKEVVEATVPGGVLHPWRRAMLPVVAALGAAALPALVHLRWLTSSTIRC